MYFPLDNDLESLYYQILNFEKLKKQVQIWLNINDGI